jgi:hypothetical protein
VRGVESYLKKLGFIDWTLVGYAMRSGKNVHVMDSWCARRTPRTLKYLNTLIARITQNDIDKASRPQGCIHGVTLRDMILRQSIYALVIRGSFRLGAD